MNPLASLWSAITPRERIKVERARRGKRAIDHALWTSARSASWRQSSILARRANRRVAARRARLAVLACRTLIAAIQNGTPQNTFEKMTSYDMTIVLAGSSSPSEW
jgi:hypothetical protein